MSTLSYVRVIFQVLSFVAALFATVWAVELYSLLKTGEVGKAWRVVILATIVFAIGEIVNFGEIFELLPPLHMHEYIALPFIILLAIACYMQRKAFFMPQHFRRLLFTRMGDTNGRERRTETYHDDEDDFSLEELEEMEPVDERE